MPEDTPLQNINELKDRLRKLDICISKSTLWRWVKNGLIPPPKKPGDKSRVKGVWDREAIIDAAGAYVLRGGSGQGWSHRAINDKTVKEIKQFAEKLYSHPYAVLSVPDGTGDDCDPPFENIIFSAEVNCPPKIAQFITPYIIATQKACRGCPLKKRALVTFRWGESARMSAGGVYERPLYGISLSKAPQDELRFMVGGQDVRAWLLQDRALMRELRARDPAGFEKRGLRITKRIKRPIAADEPVEIRDADNTCDKVYDHHRVKWLKSRGDKRIVDHRFKRKWNFKEPPNVPWAELQLRLAVAAHRESGKPWRIKRGKQTGKSRRRKEES